MAVIICIRMFRTMPGHANAISKNLVSVSCVLPMSKSLKILRGYWQKLAGRWTSPNPSFSRYDLPYPLLLKV